MACLLGHKWDDGKCVRCGEKRYFLSEFNEDDLKYISEILNVVISTDTGSKAKYIKRTKELLAKFNISTDQSLDFITQKEITFIRLYVRECYLGKIKSINLEEKVVERLYYKLAKLDDFASPEDKEHANRFY